MKLRPMTMDDADFMLYLKNDIDTRKFAIKSHEEIKKEDHIKWLEQNIQFFQIIEGKTMPYGAIRIQNGEISIWIAKQFRNNRVGTIILNSVSKKGMTAKIVISNIASMRAFIRAGFKPISFHNTYYIFEK